MKRVPARTIPIVVFVVVVLATAASGGLLATCMGLPLSDDEYNLAAWEARHFPNRWLYLIGHAGEGSSREEDDAKVRRYLELQGEAEDLESEVSRLSATNAPEDELRAASRLLEATRGERDGLEPGVQAILEGRVSSVASGLGMKTTLPLFSRVHWLFPPVDFEFEDPPYVLVISPRERVAQEEATLLRSDLSLEDAERLEKDAEESGKMSALVVPTGGIGAYPAIVEPRDDYLSTLRLVCHEWLHGWLFFHPLGARYFESDALRTINETVADIVGSEMGSLVEAAYPLASPTPSPTPGGTAEPREGVDVDQELRRLRLEVDRLLAEGEVAEAEMLMEETRQSLAERGHYFRRINQAFFAFYGLYGTGGASSSPIGPKLEELRRRAGSLGEFIRVASSITSEGDLDRLLAER